MTAVGDSDPILATKCLDFCQALSSQGVAFNFSLSIGSTFSFSLDTRVKASVSPGTKKRSSPSTLKRNARRKEEFLKKKQNPAVEGQKKESAADEASAKCSQCDLSFSSEEELKKHVGDGHGAPVLPTPEKERMPDHIVDLLLTPIHGQRIEEETKSSPGRELFPFGKPRCKSCDKSFECENDVKYHAHEVHNPTCDEKCIKYNTLCTAARLWLSKK